MQFRFAFIFTKRLFNVGLVNIEIRLNDAKIKRLQQHGNKYERGEKEFHGTKVEAMLCNAYDSTSLQDVIVIIKADRYVCYTA